MTATPLRRVGKVLSAHGIRGELRAVIFSGDRSAVATWPKLYLLASSSESKACTDPKEFKLLRCRNLREREIVLQLQGVVDRNAAEALAGSWIEVAQECFVSQPGESIFLSEIENFLIVDDVTANSLGTVREFSSNGPQDLLGIHFRGQRYWLPLVPAFVQHIDFEKKLLRVQLPEGLLELAEPISDLPPPDPDESK